MAEAFVELGATGVNHLVENHWEKGYDRLTKGDRKKDRPGKSRNQLPSPERERDPPTRTAAAGDTAGDRRGSLRSESLERESETSRRVTREYENERDDPTRSVKSVLPDRRRGRDSAKMSYANGYAPSHGRSQRGRYDDDEDSDYDDREGRRYRTSGRGYDDRGDRGYPYDREIIETERYKGPARSHDARRMENSAPRGYDASYGAGAVAPYRRSQNDASEVSRRSYSRGRQDKYERDERDRSYSGSRSRSRSRGGGGGGGWREKVDETFDTTIEGLGIGLAGAVVGGLAGRQFGKQNKNRDILLGALVGGLGANAAENKYKDWKGERKDKLEKREERWEQKWDGRSRSAMR